MANILTTIETQMQTLIGGMTILNGYNFDWATVNTDDLTKGGFPRADIWLEEENNLDELEGGTHSQSYRNQAVYRIEVYAQLTSVATNPNKAIRAELNKCLVDLKKLFGTNFSINGSCDRILYVGMNRETKMSGDVFAPVLMVTEWNVYYSQDRLDPDIMAC